MRRQGSKRLGGQWLHDERGHIQRTGAQAASCVPVGAQLRQRGGSVVAILCGWLAGVVVPVLRAWVAAAVALRHGHAGGRLGVVVQYLASRIHLCWVLCVNRGVRCHLPVCLSYVLQVMQGRPTGGVAACKDINMSYVICYVYC